MNKNNSYNYKIGINELKKASKLFPNGSGVYKFIGYQNEPLYVGKAKNLKKGFLHIWMRTVKQEELKHS